MLHGSETWLVKNDESLWPRNLELEYIFINRDTIVCSIYPSCICIWHWCLSGLDTSDQWCLWHILHIPYTAHVSNSESAQELASHQLPTFIKQRWLKLFGHMARADQTEDHNHA